MTDSDAYFRGAFGLDRRLEQENTLVYYWMSPSAFFSQATAWMAVGLVMGWHLLFLFTRWTWWRTFFRDIRLYPFTMSKQYPDPEDSLMVLFTSAFISLMFSFNMQPWFYPWAAAAYPFLIDKCDSLPPFAKIAALVVVDFNFRTHHGLAELRLINRHVCFAVHCVILLSLFRRGLKAKGEPCRAKNE